MAGGVTETAHSTIDRATARIRRFLENETTRLGFSAWGICRPEDLTGAGEHLRAFVDEGRHGTMNWMADRLDERSNPSSLWPEARSVIMLTMNYGPETDPLETLELKDRASISVYARNRDYHDLIKGRLKELAGRFTSRFGGDVKVFVDTAPVMEKPLAALAGIGWQGKHTNLVSRESGSWIFLGSIFSTLVLEGDESETDHCGSCRACLDICPTSAFPAPYQIDARRCISYLTIENKGPIPVEFRAAMGNRIYGCDDCLAACPWNKFASVTSEAKLAARHDLNAPPIADLLRLDDENFRNFFVGSPIKRIGRDRFMRNVLIAAGNSADPTLIEPCRLLLQDASSLVRGAAVWALSRLLGGEDFRLLASQRGTDQEIEHEWMAALEHDA